MEIHIGSLIRRRLDEKGYSVVWLARQLACSRTNVYKILRSHTSTPTCWHEYQLYSITTFHSSVKIFPQQRGRRKGLKRKRYNVEN